MLQVTGRLGMRAKKFQIFQRRFHLRRCCRVVRSQNGAERGARGRRACLCRAPRSFSHFSFCNAERRLLTQVISQPKFHENWATKVGIKKKDKIDRGNMREKQKSSHIEGLSNWVSGIPMSQLVPHNVSYPLAKIPRWRMNFSANWLVLQRGLINLKRLG